MLLSNPVEEIDTPELGALLKWTTGGANNGRDEGTEGSSEYLAQEGEEGT